LLFARQAAEDDLPLLRSQSRLGRLALALPSKPFAALHSLFGLALVGALSGRDTLNARGELEDIDTLGTIAQLGIVAAREALLRPKVREPLRRGLTIVTSVLSLLGALAERFAITEAGKLSAEDPLPIRKSPKAPQAGRAPRQRSRLDVPPTHRCAGPRL
jgi:hypothetical protein